MLHTILVLWTTLACQEQNAITKPSAPASTISTTTQVLPDVPAPVPVDLARVRRIYVDTFGDDPVSKQVQSMLITALVESKRFQVTENRESADAIMKGVATEASSKDFHAASENSSLATGGGGFNAQVADGVGRANGSAAHVSTSHTDSSAYTETTYIARLSIRLVNISGDVLWATTQETTELRDRPISSELATRASRLLLRDCQGILDRGQVQVDPYGVPNKDLRPSILSSAKKIVLRVKGDKAMETEIAKKILAWGRLSIVPSIGEADLTLEITQTGKYDWIRGTGVTAAAELKDAETSRVLWSATKGGSWAMSGYSTRAVARQIADEFIKFVDAGSK
jgi:hypothetical protein